MNFACGDSGSSSKGHACGGRHKQYLCAMWRGAHFRLSTFRPRWLDVLLRCKFQCGACMSRAARVFNKEGINRPDRLSTIRSSLFFLLMQLIWSVFAVKDWLPGGLGEVVKRYVIQTLV